MEGKLLHQDRPTLGRLPEVLHCGGRQCRLQADAADPYESKRNSCCAHGKEHHDA